MQQLEKLLEMPPETFEQVAIFYCICNAEASVEGVHRAVERIQESVADMPSFVESRVISCQEEIIVLTEAIETRLESFVADLRILKQALRSGLADERPTIKVKVPDPKPFEGARSLKELENFL